MHDALNTRLHFLTADPSIPFRFEGGAHREQVVRPH